MVVYCTTDLIFATRIRSTAESIGAVTRPARDAEKLDARLNRVDDGKPNEPVRLVLVDLEMGDAGLDLIERCKSHPQVPLVVAYGSHVATDLLSSAKDRGADEVLPRSLFVQKLQHMLSEYGKPAEA
ncbi:MAG: hypothetical protein ACOC1G_01625 [Phycisphaeraceae bacterium]